MPNVILKGSIFDGVDYYENGIVVVDQDNGIITEVGAEDAVEAPSGAKVIGGSGQTILPGLIDAHVHFFGSKTDDLITWVTTPETLVVLQSVRQLLKPAISRFHHGERVGEAKVEHTWLSDQRGGRGRTNDSFVRQVIRANSRRRRIG